MKNLRAASSQAKIQSGYPLEYKGIILQHYMTSQHRTQYDY